MYISQCLSTDAKFSVDRGCRMLWNAQLHQLLPGFRGTLSTDPNWFIFKPDRTNETIVKSASGRNIRINQTVREISRLPVWNPIASIVFCIGLLPVVPQTPVQH